MMRSGYDVIVIGAGLNGLTAAACLARAGLRVVIVEQRAMVGGSAATVQLAPGFRVDSILDDAGWVSPALVSELGLAEKGLELLRPDPTAWTPLPDGGGLAVWRDPARTDEELRRISPTDASRWPDFAARIARYAEIIGQLYAMPAPNVLSAPALGEFMPLLQLGRRLRGLGRREMTDFLRTLPLAIEELLEDWFETDALKALVAADGVRGLFLGPRSGGSAFALLHHRVGAEPGDFGPRGVPHGGVGRLAELLTDAVREKGGEIRLDAAVERVLIVNGRAVGVVLAGGDELRARAVASSVDPSRTFLELVGAVELQPEFVRAVGNVRMHGIWSKVNLALGELPSFRGADARSAGAGRILLSDGLVAMERAYDAAKYGRISETPTLELRIPTVADSTLAPKGRHVMSVRVQYTPAQLRDGKWDDAQRDTLLDRVIDRIAEYAPNVRSSIIEAQLLTPADLEAELGASRGDTSHGQLALDQILFMRPVAGWARYHTPIEGLFLCGAGAHPGPGVAGGAGRLAATAIARGLKAGLHPVAAEPRQPAASAALTVSASGKS